MLDRPPVRIFDCGHERAEDVAFAMRSLGHHVDYQKVGDISYCRTCMRERKIVEVKT